MFRLWPGSFTYQNIWDLPLIVWQHFAAVADAWEESAKKEGRQ